MRILCDSASTDNPTIKHQLIALDHWLRRYALK
jgi:hypothetical protein